MVFKRFSVQIGLRLGLLLTLMLVLSLLLTTTDTRVGPALIALVIVALMVGLIRYVGRSNQEVARFVAALDHRDFAQRFDLAALGPSFDRLAQSFNRHLSGARAERAEQERRTRYLRSLLEQSPVPLMTLEAPGCYRLINHAARRLFGRSEVANQDDIDRHCPALGDLLATMQPGEQRLIDFTRGDETLKFSLSQSLLTLDQSVIRLVSLQNIQREIEGTELAAWRQLVKVLTHEIMNSITPISSLSRTAADLLATVDDHEVPALIDAREAVATVARRSDGLTQFVASYNSLARLPDPVPGPVALAPLFDDIARLTGETARLVVRVEPEDLSVRADREQLEQALINLIGNARDALAGRGDGIIELRGQVAGDGGRDVIISVGDNGPGIPADIREKVFIPFYTTKKTGSGIGLALARQIVVGHGGSIRLEVPAAGGARILMLFPAQQPAALNAAPSG